MPVVSKSRYMGNGEPITGVNRCIETAKQIACHPVECLVRADKVIKSEAQQASKIPKLGWAAARPVARQRRRELPPRAGCPRIHRRQIDYDRVSLCRGQTRAPPALAEELVRLNVDVIIAPTTVEVRAARTRQRRSRSFFITCLIRSAPD